MNGKYDIFHSLVDVCIENPESTIEDKIYPIASKEVLHSLKSDFSTRGKWYQRQVFLKMRSLYAHASRKPLLKILKNLTLKAENKSGDDLLNALCLILKEETYTIDGTFLKDYDHLIKCEKGELDFFSFEIIVLSKIKDLLSHKGIFVEGAYRYRDNLLDVPKDFDINKESYYKELGLLLKEKDFIEKLKENLKNALSDLNDSILENQFVKISNTGHIGISPSLPQKEPFYLEKGQQEISKKYPSLNFLQILSETNYHVDFLKKMTSINEFDRLDKKDIYERLILCLYAIGSNTGLKKISRANYQQSYDDLKYVFKRYITPENVRSATVQIINRVLRIRNPKIWGEASTSVSCDSTMVSSWTQNLLSEWHARYRQKGVMIYWHIDSKSLCIYAHPKVCASSEVGSMIKGILNHDSTMNIDKAYVDTHGQSLIGFAITNMLGFDLLPRIKGIHKQKLAFLQNEDFEKYPNIAPILGDPIQFKNIEENYDMIVKYLCALKYGTIDSDVFIKRFSQYNYQNPIYKGLNEIGRIFKTIFITNYLKDETLRIEINEGLNVVERVNSLMGFIFYGKLGEISSNDENFYELFVACLHLLQASMVFVNTHLIQDVLKNKSLFNILEQEDLRALTPIIHDHINPYGSFVLDLNKRIIKSKEIKNGYT
ncbi:MAG: Tn3 family transposase ISNpu13 [Holosporales bacterium]